MRKIAVLLAALLAYAGIALAAVNINSATKEQLETLNGVGPVKAQAIIDYRKKNGSFKALEDIKKVDGIGDATFDKIRGDIALSGTTVVPKADSAPKAEKKDAAAEKKAADDKKAEEKKAAADKKAEEKKAAADKKSTADKKASDKKAEDKKAAADKKAADEKKAADDKKAAKKEEEKKK